MTIMPPAVESRCISDARNHSGGTAVTFKAFMVPLTKASLLNSSNTGFGKTNGRSTTSVEALNCDCSTTTPCSFSSLNFGSLATLFPLSEGMREQATTREQALMRKQNNDRWLNTIRYTQVFA